MKCLAVFVFYVIATISADLSEFTTSTTSFTFDFFKHAFVPNENAVLSPVSIQSSLSMFYPLAGDKMSPAMQRHLYLPADKNRATSKLRSFLKAQRQSKAKSSSLKIVSKVYHVKAKLKPQVKPLFKDAFGTKLQVANFHNQAKVAASINSWVNRTTAGMIEKFMEPDEVNVDNALMLLNVVALNASWEVPFDEGLTRSEPFQFTNGEHPVDMMSQEGKLMYADLWEYECEALELPYKNGTDLSMVIVLPGMKKSLEEVINGLNVSMYEKLNERLNKERIQLAMPKFKIQKKTDVKDLLKEMGLSVLFEEADLDVFVRDKSGISDVTQTAFIKVDEKGTEAAAATGIQVGLRSFSQDFYVDRPFLYLIRKRSTKDIIFIGHYSVYEPLQ